jgi:molybdopterin synthase sulfur carrier subunit
VSVRVLFFASLKDALGCDEHLLEIGASLQMGALIDRLSAELGPEARSALTAESIRVAVNQELRNGAVEICDGDEVAFLPPVTGG